MAAEAGRLDDERAPAAAWHPLVRIAFRFGFVFVGVGMAAPWVAHALLRSFGLPTDTVLTVAKWTALHPLSDWVGTQFFGTRADYSASGSSDTATQWVAEFTLLLVAVVATAVWSILDRRRPGYDRLYGWFRLLLRAVLVAALLLYGMVKALPSQMTFSLERLVEPFGDMSPMSILWASTAMSEPYEIALGAAELTAALLLVLPRTAGLGAVLAFIVSLQVAVLNLTFDVPVKLFALQLVVYSAILAAPDIARIVKALTGHAVPAPDTPPLVATPRAQRMLLLAQVLFGAWLLFTSITEGYDAYRSYGNGREHSPLYGIWNVTEYTVAGQTLPPLVDYSGKEHNAQMLGANERFRRIIFDNTIGVTAQRMDDSLVSFPGEVDADAHTVTLAKDRAHQWKIATFAYEQPEAGELILEGQVGGRPVRMRLARLDLDRLPSVSRGFHWVQPAPYFR
ncbi:hypothetical protein [Nocardia inohanensis]|uniref:hypothetical protein n=1 Tax=Nocardia inohanensis TaxID=209246 RepID=UPI000A004941|nr:hypothetical protein [Nocardia inohanensis]